MSYSQDQHSSVERLVAAYISSGRNKLSPVSIGTAIIAIRSAAPTVSMTDQKLADAIAAAAVRYGKPVHFDRSID